jgi:hypothetical protein
MRLLLAKMLWHFDFELDDPEDNWYGNMKGIYCLGMGASEGSPNAH